MVIPHNINNSGCGIKKCMWAGDRKQVYYKPWPFTNSYGYKFPQLHVLRRIKYLTSLVVLDMVREEQRTSDLSSHPWEISTSNTYTSVICTIYAVGTYKVTEAVVMVTQLRCLLGCSCTNEINFLTCNQFNYNWTFSSLCTSESYRSLPKVVCS